MAEIIETGIIFSDGLELSLGNISINELSNGTAINTRVVFTIRLGNVTITADSIPVGSYSNNIWTIGNMPLNSITGSFIVTIEDNDTSSVEIDVEIFTDSYESNTSNNKQSYKFYGLSLDQVSAFTIANHIENIPTYTDDAAAGIGGLVAGELYVSGTTPGVLMIKL